MGNTEKKIKFKITNHLITKGNKKTCEKIVLKSFKKIQKNSLKSCKKIIKTAIINASRAFRIFELKQTKNKKQKTVKEIPKFIFNNIERISWSLKIILEYSKKQNQNGFYQKLKQEIVRTSKNKSSSINKRIEVNKQASIKKHLLLYFRW